MPFRTKLDFSSNRQIKQFPANITQLSGGTSFGVPFSALTTGPDLTTSAITNSYPLVSSSYSGNSGTTNFTWGVPEMSLGESQLSALTPSNSATTQNVLIFTAATTTVIDGNTIALTYTGVTYPLVVVTMDDLGGGDYSGTLLTNTVSLLSASTLDYTGRTIWVDVSGYTRTNDLIVTRNPQVGYVLTCIDTEGKVEWQASSGGTGSTSYWSASTGTNAIVVNNSNSLASGTLSLAEGIQTTASGNYSHAEGGGTVAYGLLSHAEGRQTSAYGDYSHTEGSGTTASTDASYAHAEGYGTFVIADGAHAEGWLTKAGGDFGSHAEGSGSTASGQASHAEGQLTIAAAIASHAEGSITTASGLWSHAGGLVSIASGNASFVHGTGSTATGNTTVVLGNNIIGGADNSVYVSDLYITNLLTTDPLATNGSGKVIAGVSDARLKDNIKTIGDTLSLIKQLRPVSFIYKPELELGNATHFGLIAQEVQTIFPELVKPRAGDSEHFNVSYIEIIPLLIKAINELNTDTTTQGSVYLETQSILAEDNDIQLNFSGNQQTAIGGGIRVLHALGQNKEAEFITDENGDWITNNDIKAKALTIPLYTPTSSSDIAGNEGNITRDDDYIYIKTKNGWKRSNLESF